MGIALFLFVPILSPLTAPALVVASSSAHAHYAPVPSAHSADFSFGRSPPPQGTPRIPTTSLASGWKGISLDDPLNSACWNNPLGDCAEPDIGLAVGNGYVVETASSEIMVWTTAGVLQAAVTAPAFFHQKGPYWFLFPDVVYDNSTSRWFGILLNGTNYATTCNPGPCPMWLGVSLTSNPLGTWKFYNVTYGGNWQPLLPRVQTYASNVVISAAIEGTTYSRVWIYNKTQVESAATSPANTTFNVGYGAFPATVASPTPNVYLVAEVNDAYPLETIELTGSPPGTVGLYTYDYKHIVNYPVYAQQHGTSGGLDTTGGLQAQPGSISSAVFWQGIIWAGSTVSCVKSIIDTPTCVQLWEVGANNGTKLQDFNWSGGGSLDDFYPAMAMGPQGDLVLTYGASNVSTNPADWITSRSPTAPPGFLQTPWMDKMGAGPVTGGPSGINSFGYYQGAVTDPVNASRVWLASEWGPLTSNGTAGFLGNFSTWIQPVSLGPSPLSAWASSSPTSGPAPLATWLNGTVAGGAPPYSLSWRFGDGTSGTGPNNQHTYANPGAYVAHLWVNDSGGAHAQANATVNVWAPLASVSVSPSSVSLAPLGVQSFTSTPSCTGGPCPAGTVFSWSMNRAVGSFNSTTGSVVKFTAGSSTGTTYLFVNATLNGLTIQSAAVPITISSTSPPSISSFTASPSPIEVGWTTYFNVSASGGTGALSYAFSGLPAGCASSNVPGLPCTPTVSGTFTVRVYANDTAADSATTTASLTVNPSSAGGPAISGFSAIPSSVSLGSMSTFSVSASGGTGTLSYAYAGLPSGCSSSDTASLPCTSTVTGTFTVRVYVNDSAARSVTAATSLTVNPSSGGPVISGFSASPFSLTLGVSTTLTVSASGGTGTLAYAYAGLPPGCATADTASLSCTPSTSGSFIVRVYANDTASHAATAIASLTVNPSSTVALASVSIVPAGANLSTGASQAFSAAASCTGGPCPAGLTYAWTLSSSLGSLNSPAGSTTTFTAGSSSGTETLTATANLNGVSKSASATVVISAPSSAPPTLLGLPPTAGYLVLIAIIAVAVGVTIAVLPARRRSRQRSSSASEDEHVVPRSR